MVKVTELPVTSVQRDPARLPITALLLVPDDPSIAVSPFNLPGAVNHLMGSSGWDRATKVIRPRIWASGWSREQLEAFVSAPFSIGKRPFPPEAVADIREAEFPPMDFPIDLNRAWPPYEIIHALGNYGLAWKTDEPVLRLALEKGHVQEDDFLAGRVLAAGAFRDVLVAVGTRLLILQVAKYSVGNAVGLARYVVGAGGSAAAVVVSGGTPPGLEAYFTELYANIIHNKPMHQVVKPGDAAGAPDVELIIGEDGEDALRFDRWFRGLNELIDAAQLADRRVLADIAGDSVRLLHADQVGRLKQRIYAEALGGETSAIIGDLSRLDSLRRSIDFAHETGGVIPLSEVAESAPRLEAAELAIQKLRLGYPGLSEELQAEINDMAAAAPRVLNANFEDSLRGKLLDTDEPLRSGRPYELLVDVGPRWNTVPSLVKGSDAFPENALPPGEEGYRVRVVLFSEDFMTFEPVAGRKARGAGTRRHSGARKFEPVKVPPLAATPLAQFTGEYRAPVASAEIWVPRSTGRSHPIIGGKRAGRPGPVRLPVVAPGMPANSSKVRQAGGRLSLYYENNLLQSGIVRVTVTRDGQRQPARFENSVEIDYVLSGSFAELGKYATRALGDDDESVYPIGLNITLNDDGAGGHRLMIENRGDLTVWRPYDPAAADGQLQLTRDKLKECFWERDDDCAVVGTGDVDRRSALGADNQKSVKQFKCDLFQLAYYGSELYAHAFGQVSLPRLLDYLERLHQALASRTVIQVARTALAQYVYPWALVYDIPLPNREIPGGLRWCEVLKEWGGGEARRTSPPGKACPYQNSAEHRQDTLCPYGFWGLKHYIEQPINVQPIDVGAAGSMRPLSPDAHSKMRVSGPLTLAVGATRDSSLPQATLQAHLNRIQQLATYVPVGGAGDLQAVRNVLKQPDLVYFLCHGESDAQGKPYLGVGPRDGNPRHRVYAESLFAWARTQHAFWQDRHPLVFINGCHTADLKPGDILSFVTTFAVLGASAAVGTEISIRLPLAAEVAENLLKQLIGGRALGAAMYELRWDLANKGNLLGLAYTPYGLSNLVIEIPDRAGSTISAAAISAVEQEDSAP